MSEHQDDAASERDEIAARVASFKATQQKFQREREEYFVATLESARQAEHVRHTFDEEPPLWS